MPAAAVAPVAEAAEEAAVADAAMRGRRALRFQQRRPRLLLATPASLLAPEPAVRARRASRLPVARVV